MVGSRMGCEDEKKRWSGVWSLYAARWQLPLTPVPGGASPEQAEPTGCASQAWQQRGRTEEVQVGAECGMHGSADELAKALGEGMGVSQGAG